jgi:hypothetical protein
MNLKDLLMLCMQEDGYGDIFVGTSASALYYIQGTNVAPQPTTSPMIFPTSPTMNPTKTPTFSPIAVGVICPPSYQSTRVLSDVVLKLEYSFVRENAPHNGTIFCCPNLIAVAHAH